MRQIILLLLLSMSIWAQAQGDLTDGKTIGNNQDARFRLTLLAGFNASQIDGDDSAGFNKVGVNAGGQINILLDRTDWVGRFQPSVGIGFSQIGSRSVNNDNIFEPFSFKMAYAQIPVMINYIDQRWMFSAGFAYGRLVNLAYEEGGVDATETVTDVYKSDGLNFIGGMTYYVTRNIGINIHWEHSTYSITKPEGRRQVHRLITFRAAYTF